MTRKLLDTSYSQAMTDGKIQWVEDDFQANEAIAKQFEVAASCVVVADIENGKVLNYKRLDDVWTKMKDPKAFNQYISEAIDGYLQDNGGKK